MPSKPFAASTAFAILASLYASEPASTQPFKLPFSRNILVKRRVSTPAIATTFSCCRKSANDCELRKLECTNDKSLITNALARSEEHTSELQSRPHLVCRLLLEKKKKKK